VRYLGDRPLTGSVPDNVAVLIDGLNALIERLVDLHPPTRDTLPLVYARLMVDQGGYSNGGAGAGLQSPR
jgi:hypothetical protein